MFSIFRSDPAKKLDKLYKSKLEEAMQAQRNGDIEGYAHLSVEAEKLYQDIQALKKE